MNVPVTVYTKSNCVQCESTKRRLDKRGVRYTIVDLEKNPEILAQFIEQGHTSAPIVTTDTKIWSGFRHDKIDNLADFIDSLKAKGEVTDPHQTVIDLLEAARVRYNAENNHLDASAMELAIAVVRGEV